MLHISFNFILEMKNKNSLEIWAIRLVSKAIYTTMFKMTWKKELGEVGFVCRALKKKNTVTSDNYN